MINLSGYWSPPKITQFIESRRKRKNSQAQISKVGKNCSEKIKESFSVLVAVVAEVSKYVYSTSFEAQVQIKITQKSPQSNKVAIVSKTSINLMKKTLSTVCMSAPIIATHILLINKVQKMSLTTWSFMGLKMK